jgi:4-hydroxy-tetrahydrodipicolinate synthase
MLEGAYTAIVTPFTAGAVDFARLGELIDRQIAAGCGIVPCGTTGENPTLSDEEFREVVRFTVDHVAGRVRVIAGAGSNCTRTAVALVQHAQRCRADAVLVITPYYNKPTRRGLVAHYTAVAAATDLPIVLYNVPGRTGVDLLPEIVAELARIETIVAIKEASGFVARTSRLLELCPQLEVLSGEDTLVLPMMAVGAVGTINVSSNVAPAEVAALVRHMLAGELKAALQLHQRLFPLAEAMFSDTNPIPVKNALQQLGLDSGELRLPLIAPAPEIVARVTSALRAFGLLAN